MTDAELRAAYDAHPERFRQPASVHLSQLLFTSKDDAEEALRALARGEAWIEVSRKKSAAPNAKDGGPLGHLSLADLPRDFAHAVEKTPVGKTTPVLAATHGFHVFRVDERAPERTVPFEEAKEGLRLAVLQERADGALKAAIAEARAAYPVRVIEDHLPFPYVGDAEKTVATP
jgi:parvulin-like peptidyl-prolyl isomerase